MPNPIPKKSTEYLFRNGTWAVPYKKKGEG